jgi:ABC-type Fe3+-siderophore transport system permease subunit
MATAGIRSGVMEKAVGVGVALAVAGTAFQSLFHNHLVFDAVSALSNCILLKELKLG